MNCPNPVSSIRLASSGVLLASLLFTAACSGGSAAPIQSFVNDPQAASPQIQERNSVTSMFGIPSGITGDVNAGQLIVSGSCSHCHGNLGARDFPTITAALSSVNAMRSLKLTQQQVADVTAYLNRASIPVVTDPGTPGTGGTPPATDPGSGNGGGSGSVGDDGGADDDGVGSGDDGAADDDGVGSGTADDDDGGGVGEAGGDDDGGLSSGGGGGDDDSGEGETEDEGEDD